MASVGKHAKGSRRGISAIPSTHTSDRAPSSSQIHTIVPAPASPATNETIVAFPTKKTTGQAVSSSVAKENEVQRYSRANYSLTYKKSRKWPKGLAVILTILLLYSGILGITGKLALDDMHSITPNAKNFAKQLITGDTDTFSTTAIEIADQASHMRRLIDNPLWILPALLPVIGPDVASAKVYARTLDDLSSNLLLPIAQSIDAANTGSVIRPDGSFNADTLQIIFNTLDSSHENIKQHYYEATRLTQPSIDALASYHQRSCRILGAFSTVAEAASDLASSIHYLLGADGNPRKYAVIAENNSEIRTTGGFIGSFGVLTITNGSLSMGDFISPHRVFSTYQIGTTDEGGGAPLTNEEETIFGRRLRLAVSDANFHPDFARASQIFKWSMEDQGWGSIDGVIGIDTICFCDFLAIIGSVTTDSGITINEENAATFLLHDIYKTFESNDEQDAFFADIATKTLNTLLADINQYTNKLFRIIWHARDTRHLSTYFTNQNAQSAAILLGFSGTLTYNETTPSLGVFLNNGSASKMSWYITMDNIVKQREAKNGQVFHQVTTLVKNNITQEEAATLPSYIGGKLSKEAPGQTAHWIYLFSPVNGTIANLDINTTGHFHNRPVSKFPGVITSEGMQHATYCGMDVWYGLIYLNPGDYIELNYDVFVSPNSSSDLHLDETPTLGNITGYQ